MGNWSDLKEQSPNSHPSRSIEKHDTVSKQVGGGDGNTPHTKNPQKTPLPHLKHDILKNII